MLSTVVRIYSINPEIFFDYCYIIEAREKRRKSERESVSEIVREEKERVKSESERDLFFTVRSI